jgi:T5SS/PEP-CTERM-associated repeat protein
MMSKRSRNNHYIVGNAVAGLSLISFMYLCLFCYVPPGQAEVTWSGDIDPPDPTTWTSSTTGYIGKNGYGTLNITKGSNVLNYYGYIGYESGAAGEVTVDGSGSTWTNHSSLLVGLFGSGTLNITSSGVVNSHGSTIGRYYHSSGEVTVNGPGSTWTNSRDFIVGSEGDGTLNIKSGGEVSNNYCYIGHEPGSTGKVTVDGSGSKWTSYISILVGLYGNGTLIITEGAVTSHGSTIGRYYQSSGKVTVDGTGSTWTNNDNFLVGSVGSGTLNITNGGLVSVAGILIIDYDMDGDGFINMATGGMLALHGDADDSIFDFLGLIDGTDAIRYWDTSISDWANITGATYGEDYTLSYLTEGDLAGYTMLTVTAIPEPATLSLLVLGGATILRRRRSARSCMLMAGST